MNQVIRKIINQSIKRVFSLRYTIIQIWRIFSVIFLCGSAVPSLADNLTPGQPMTEEQIEAWFNDDSEERALAVNEGALEFLLHIPDKPAHHSHNRLIINNKSLETGWVGLVQCHSQLDSVPEAQIVYRYRRMKNLHIESFSGISKAWIEASSVQLKGVQTGAKLCISAEVGILYSLKDGSFILKNGPFHRKFLDGYYPMQVTLNIHFPSELIQLEMITPKKQDGFTVRMEENELHVDAWFEGELTTEIRFTPALSRK